MNARFALVAVALAGFACSAPKAVGTYPQASVVLVSIDTLRADHLALYGYREGRTPNLDALGRDGLVFDDVISHVPLTLPAHASIFTGLLPPRHGVRDNIGFSLKPSDKTLAERFKAAGLATGGAISAYVLRAQTGISRGFDVYDDALILDASNESLGALQRDGGVAVASLLKFVDAQAGKRFFAFLHLYEPHTPWSPPAAYRDLKNPYDGDVAYADELVGLFLEGLRARGLADRTILVLTSDHGEGLGDHGEREHGLFLYREAVHVPLVLRLPDGAGRGARIRGPVAQVDIAPTILDLAGLPFAGMDGVSLRGAIAAGQSESRVVYSETLYPRYHFGWSELYAATDSRFRFIRAPKPELYDISKDPGERQNLAGDRAPAMASMDAWLGRMRTAVTAPEAVDAQTREKLAALGYVGASTGSLAASGTLPDPKDKIGAYEELKKGLAFRASGQNAEAVDHLRKVLAENPLMTDAWETLGLGLIALGREKEGIEALDRAIRIDPLRAEPHMALAKLYALDGKMAAAVGHAEMASRTEPGKSFEILAQIMMDGKREADALVFARRSVAADPQRSMSLFILGTVARQHGRCAEALASFTRAIAAAGRAQGSVVRSLHFQAGDCLARLGREAEAEREFLAELRALPRSVEGRVALATLYRSQGRDAESRKVLSDLVEGAAEASVEDYWAVVRTFTVLGEGEAARSFAAQARQRFPNDSRFR